MNKFEQAAKDRQYQKRDTREARLGEDLEPLLDAVRKSRKTDRTVLIGTLLAFIITAIIFAL